MKTIMILFLFFMLLPLFSQTQNKSDKSSKCNTVCSIEYGKCFNTCKNNDKCVEICSEQVKECRTKCKK